MKITSARAHKLLNNLQAEREFLLKREEKLSVYKVGAGEDEEKQRPDYDLKKYEARVQKLNRRIMKLRHAINQAQCGYEVDEADGLTVDQLLTAISMLTDDVKRYHDMAMRLPRERASEKFITNTYLDYELTNYDPDDVKRMYKTTRDKLTRYELALDSTKQQLLIDMDDVL